MLDPADRTNADLLELEEIAENFCENLTSDELVALVIEIIKQSEDQEELLESLMQEIEDIYKVLNGTADDDLEEFDFDLNEEEEKEKEPGNDTREF